METQTPESEDSKSKPIKKTRSKSTNKSKSCLKKISADSAKALSLISEKANKKDFGRRVKDSEIISMALTLMTDKEIKLLQEATFSEKDRLHMAHSEYVSKNGKITLDDFIGKLLRGEIKQAFN
jgi:hypothetical protein